MFDIGWQELALIGVVALVVIGPKDLPRALGQAGKWMKAARKVAGDFQRQVDTMVREAELEDVKKGVQQVNQFTIRKQIENAVDPGGEVRKALDPLGKTTGSMVPRPIRPAAPASAAPATAAPATAAPATPAPAVAAPPAPAAEQAQAVNE